MIKTLRTKLLIGLTPLLAIMVGLGLWSIAVLDHLGGRIDVILRENYASVLAAEGMKEALERLDSAAMFAIGGQEARALDQSRANRPRFLENLHIEQHNVTLVAQGEQEMADDLTRYFDQYVKLSDDFYRLPRNAVEARKQLYFNQLLPLFIRIKNRADDVLRINQANMKAEDRRAREAAARSKQIMILLLLASAAVATIVALALSRSILAPIQAVTRGARAMARGDIDQVVPVSTHDELGELATAFNTMSRTIREFRQAGTARLLRAQKTAQATIDSFPDPVVVVDPSGSIERTNPAARRILRAASSDASVPWTPPPELKGPLAQVLSGHPDFIPTEVEHALAFRDEGQERFYLPRVLAIRDDQGGTLGAAIVLQDVTKFRLVDQLKSDMVSTVSHELKTPLTSVQMAVHLLLEEAVGTLTPKQTELLLAARQDAERLLAMINDLLDLTRIEQGRLELDSQPVAPADLVGEARERFESRAQDAGITLTANVDFALRPVTVDRERIAHVFDNLIGNALDHTSRGGEVHVTAEAAGESIRFTVRDNGEGIPHEHLGRIFEKFYRVPGSRQTGGAGLGLAITQEIVTAHGGRIDVASRPGEGSTFTFTIPAAPCQPNDREEAA